jgi:hypothetical protein
VTNATASNLGGFAGPIVVLAVEGTHHVAWVTIADYA